jgi:Holliday junction resolvasome RuvABC endonuclease subunit
MLCGFDLSASSTGWCFGAGETTPTAGAWLYEGVGDDHGVLASRFRKDVINLFDRISPKAIMFERPILRPHDRVGPLRKVYGLGFLLEEICYVRGIPVRDQTLQALKKRLTGNHKAPKEEMIAAAEGHGLKLPATYSKGKKDAADAFAAWLWALEDWAPHLSSRWPPIRNGGLL